MQNDLEAFSEGNGLCLPQWCVYLASLWSDEADGDIIQQNPPTRMFLHVYWAAKMEWNHF